MASSVARRSVDVIMLGRMGFMPALDVQTRYAKQHLDECAGKPHAVGQDTLLVVEHTPVYTIGVRTRDYTEHDIHRLKATGAEFYKTNRGGLITFHGPGQLVVYPILNLKHFKPSMKWYVKQLEETLVNTLGHFDIQAQTTDETGVWVQDRKIASIGLHGTRYITTHGISLNCNTDLSWYRHIVPCGLQDIEMTSVSKELGTNLPYGECISPFLRSFGEVFDCDLELRLLDENELKAMASTQAFNSSSPSPSSSSSYNNHNSKNSNNNNNNDDVVSDSDSVSVGSLKRAAEVGLRHLCTSSVRLASQHDSVSVSGMGAVSALRGTPMW